MSPRTRATARAAGTRLETDVANYLAAHVHDGIERRAKTGLKDRGDITGVREPANGGRIVVEVKNTARWAPGEWLAEAEVERVNDDAVAGLVVAKRHGRGHPADQVVLMTLADFVALLTGRRP